MTGAARPPGVVLVHLQSGGCVFPRRLADGPGGACLAPLSDAQDAAATLRAVLAAPAAVWALWSVEGMTPAVLDDARLFDWHGEAWAEVRALTRQAQAAGRIGPGDSPLDLVWTHDRKEGR